jgi:hypothetical protein
MELELNSIKYKKISIKGYKILNMYPVYIESVYDGHEPFKIVGIRENQVELEGDFSGGTHNVIQKGWFDDDEVFVVSTVCKEQLKPNGCQEHNLYCCGGGSVINKHADKYWKNLAIDINQINQ